MMTMLMRKKARKEREPKLYYIIETPCPKGQGGYIASYMDKTNPPYASLQKAEIRGLNRLDGGESGIRTLGELPHTAFRALRISSRFVPGRHI